MQLLLIGYCRRCKSFSYLPPNENLCKEHNNFLEYIRLSKTNPILFKQLQKERQLKTRKIRNKLPINKIKINLRQRIRDLLKNEKDKSCRIGCSGAELKRHLEARFTKEMSWDNYGKYWHVDHIKPLILFNLKEENERKLANHYTNLQPLTVKDNLKKYTKYESI